MGRRSRRRASEPAQPQSPASPASTTDYTDPEGNVLALRDSLSPGTLRKLTEAGESGRAAASRDDMWQRQGELMFERLAVSWTIAGLPLSGQKELLGRYRMASADERRWLRDTLESHLELLKRG
jgi:hypothetical protein